MFADVGDADASERTCGTSISAASVFANSQAKERSREFNAQAGNELFNTMHDPIADMLTRIRNASRVKKQTVRVPYSRVKHEIARVLKSEGFLVNVEKEETPLAELVLTLKYLPGGRAAIVRIARVSKQGNRIYRPAKLLPYVLNNLGIAVVSTSKGIMTNKQARKENLGGEVLCEIY